MSHYFNNRLRPPFELIPAFLLLGIAVVLGCSPTKISPMMPGLARVFAVV
jgi:hypothetical protein